LPNIVEPIESLPKDPDSKENREKYIECNDN
jgi:hypothetical protein